MSGCETGADVVVDCVTEADGVAGCVTEADGGAEVDDAGVGAREIVDEEEEREEPIPTGYVSWFSSMSPLARRDGTLAGQRVSACTDAVRRVLGALGACTGGRTGALGVAGSSSSQYGGVGRWLVPCGYRTSGKRLGAPM